MLNPATRHDNSKIPSLESVPNRLRRRFRNWILSMKFCYPRRLQCFGRKCHLICVLLNCCWNINFHSQCNDKTTRYITFEQKLLYEIPSTFVRCKNDSEHDFIASTLLVLQRRKYILVYCTIMKLTSYFPSSALRLYKFFK